MNAGDLRDKITVRKKTSTQNARGGQDVVWSDVVSTLPAKVRSLNGRESLMATVLEGIAHYEIVVRYRSDLDSSQQILWTTNSNLELNIISAEDRLGTRQWTTIHASTEAPKGA